MNSDRIGDMDTSRSERDFLSEDGALVEKRNPRDTPHRKRTVAEKLRQCVRNNFLMILIIVAIALGFMSGFIIRQYKPSDSALMWIGFPGDLYMRLLKMCIVPLTICAVISGASRLDPKTNGKLGLTTVILVIVTHIMAVSLSISLFLAISPGSRSTELKEKELGIPVESHDIFADLLRNIVPDNVITATFRQAVTKYVVEDDDSTNANNNDDYDDNKTLFINHSIVTESPSQAAQSYKRLVTTSDGVNVLGIISVSCIFGIAAGQLGDKVSAFLNFFNHSMEIIFVVVTWFMWVTPIGVLSLIAEAVSKIDNLEDDFSDLGLFALTVTTGLIIHGAISLPVMYFLIVRKNPLKFLSSVIRPFSIAFACTNSYVAFPDIMNVIENKLKVDKRVSHIAVPLTLTLNADGSSMFISASSLFIARYTGFELSLDRIVIIAVLTIMSCLAIPGVPSASIVTIIIIMSAINVPVHNVALLFAMEWFLDRIRTGVNVVSHIAITTMTNKICQGTLKRLDKINEETTTPLQGDTGDSPV